MAETVILPPGTGTKKLPQFLSTNVAVNPGYITQFLQTPLAKQIPQWQLDQLTPGAPWQTGYETSFPSYASPTPGIKYFPSGSGGSIERGGTIQIPAGYSTGYFGFDYYPSGNYTPFNHPELQYTGPIFPSGMPFQLPEGVSLWENTFQNAQIEILKKAARDWRNDPRNEKNIAEYVDALNSYIYFKNPTGVLTSEQVGSYRPPTPSPLGAIKPLAEAAASPSTTGSTPTVSTPTVAPATSQTVTGFNLFRLPVYNVPSPKVEPATAAASGSAPSGTYMNAGGDIAPIRTMLKPSFGLPKYYSSTGMYGGPYRRSIV